MAWAISAQAAYDTKPCPTCQGLGYIRIPQSSVKYDCRTCHAKGKVPVSREEKEEIEREAQSASDLMQQFNLSPQDYETYTQIVKQAMTQVPVYDPCPICGGTGKCKACGGYMNTTLDYDLCTVCGGSGLCISCNGEKRILVGYQDNPNKDQLIAAARSILYHQSSPDPSSLADEPAVSLDNFTPNKFLGFNINKDDVFAIIGLLIGAFILYRIFKD